MDFLAVRKEISERYFEGRGIELGALHRAFYVNPEKAQVDYVDRMSTEELFEQYPELREHNLVEPTIIDNAETLKTIKDGEYDFCITSHVLEHMEDVIASLYNWFRILKPGGILYVSVPVSDNVLDKYREKTLFKHYVEDHNLKENNYAEYERRRKEHFEDFSYKSGRSFGITEDAALEERFKTLLEQDYSIHFHIFDEAVLHDLIMYVRDELNVGLEILESRVVEPEEIIFVMRKK